MAVEWFEAAIDGERWSLLLDYDHHGFPLDGRSAVLITYLSRPGPSSTGTATVLAVHHGAAARHPPLPDRMRDLVAELEWRPTMPPPGPGSGNGAG